MIRGGALINHTRLWVTGSINKTDYEIFLVDLFFIHLVCLQRSAGAYGLVLRWY